MKSLNDIKDYLDSSTASALNDFNREINTDENRDYRRGFRAGVLFSYLHTKANLRTESYAATEQPTN